MKLIEIMYFVNFYIVTDFVLIHFNNIISIHYF